MILIIWPKLWKKYFPAPQKSRNGDNLVYTAFSKDGGELKAEEPDSYIELASDEIRIGEGVYQDFYWGTDNGLG